MNKKTSSMAGSRIDDSKRNFGWGTGSGQSAR